MNEQCRGEWTSASNALADRLCRGRYQAQVGLPELAPNEESESGRVIHGAVDRDCAAAEALGR